ncbi:MAG: DUF937 domain-containing protein [Vulcanimicrobiota bacterium]
MRILEKLDEKCLKRLGDEANTSARLAARVAELAVPMMLGAARAHRELPRLVDMVTREYGQLRSNLAGYFSSGWAHFSNRQHGPDLGLVGMLFGNHGAQAAELVAAQTGLAPVQVMRMMGLLAPVVISHLEVEAPDEDSPLARAAGELVAHGNARPLEEALST